MRQSNKEDDFAWTDNKASLHATRRRPGQQGSCTFLQTRVFLEGLRRASIGKDISLARAGIGVLGC
jgi:hypothetical protein